MCIRDRYKHIHEKIESPERLEIILSSETLSSLDQFSTFTQLVEKGIQPIFSLDRKSGQTITQPGEPSELAPIELVKEAYNRGVRSLIVLDLDSVGTMKGIQNKDVGVGPLIQEIKQELSDLRIISGGGIREVEDVKSLLEAGCQHVLVASAIHELKLTPDDVMEFPVSPFDLGSGPSLN